MGHIIARELRAYYNDQFHNSLVSCSRALPVSAHTLTSQPQLNRLRMLWAALHTGHMEPDHQPLKSKLVFELVSECVCVCL